MPGFRPACGGRKPTATATKRRPTSAASRIRLELGLDISIGPTAMRLAVSMLFVAFLPAFPQSGDQPVTGPWTDKTLSPDQRADLLLEQLTLDEKLELVHGGSPYMGESTPQPARSLGGAGWIPGIPRLGIPDFQMTDGRSGVANIGAPRPVRHRPALVARRRRHLGSRPGLRLRRHRRQGGARARLQRLPGRHGQPHPRAPQRPQLRVLERRPHRHRQNAWPRAEGNPGPGRDRQHQPLRRQRPGKRPV